MVILSLNIVSLNLIGNFFYSNEICVCMFSQKQFIYENIREKYHFCVD